MGAVHRSSFCCCLWIIWMKWRAVLEKFSASSFIALKVLGRFLFINLLQDESSKSNNSLWRISSSRILCPPPPSGQSHCPLGSRLLAIDPTSSGWEMLLLLPIASNCARENWDSSGKFPSSTPPSARKGHYNRISWKKIHRQPLLLFVDGKYTETQLNLPPHTVVAVNK